MISPINFVPKLTKSTVTNWCFSHQQLEPFKNIWSQGSNKNFKRFGWFGSFQASKQQNEAEQWTIILIHLTLKKTKTRKKKKTRAQPINVPSSIPIKLLNSGKNKKTQYAQSSMTRVYHCPDKRANYAENAEQWSFQKKLGPASKWNMVSCNEYFSSVSQLVQVSHLRKQEVKSRQYTFILPLLAFIRYETWPPRNPLHFLFILLNN